MTASLYVREYAVKLVIDSIVKMLSRYTGLYNFAPFVFEFICVHLRVSAARFDFLGVLGVLGGSVFIFDLLRVLCVLRG